MALNFTWSRRKGLTGIGRRIGKEILRSGTARVLRAGWHRGEGALSGLDGLYHRWAGAPDTRASRNPLVRLAARGGLPPSTDPTSEAEQLAALAPHFDAAFYESWYGIGGASALRDYLRTAGARAATPAPISQRRSTSPRIPSCVTPTSIPSCTTCRPGSATGSMQSRGPTPVAPPASRVG